MSKCEKRLTIIDERKVVDYKVEKAKTGDCFIIHHLADGCSVYRVSPVADGKVQLFNLSTGNVYSYNLDVYNKTIGEIMDILGEHGHEVEYVSNYTLTINLI